MEETFSPSHGHIEDIAAPNLKDGVDCDESLEGMLLRSVRQNSERTKKRKRRDCHCALPIARALGIEEETANFSRFVIPAQAGSQCIFSGFRVSRCLPGMVMCLRHTLDDETFVGATLVVALNLGRHKACPYVFGGMRGCPEYQGRGETFVSEREPFDMLRINSA